MCGNIHVTVSERVQGVVVGVNCHLVSLTVQSRGSHIDPRCQTTAHKDSIYIRVAASTRPRVLFAGLTHLCSRLSRDHQ